MAKPRIIGGVAKGRTLDTPRSGTRPSPSRLREALFNILEFRERGTFLDLFSGTGALGLEAASRGWSATCVDLSKEAANVIRQNARNLKLEVTIVQGDAVRYSREHPHGFDIVCAAPPYPLDLPKLFQSLLDTKVATPEGLYIFQHPTQTKLELHYEGEQVTFDSRAYGSNVLSFLDLAKHA